MKVEHFLLKGKIMCKLSGWNNDDDDDDDNACEKFSQNN